MIDLVKRAKERYKAELMRNPIVIGVGVGTYELNDDGDDEPCIKVYVKNTGDVAQLPADQQIPDTVKLDDGRDCKVIIQELGEVHFTACPDSAFGATYRPSKGGAILSHVSAQYSGTYGAVLTDNTDGGKVVLSAGHVLANFNNAQEGDKIVQTSAPCGGTSPADDFATLKRHIPLNLNDGDVNLVDAGICDPIVNSEAKRGSFCGPIKVKKQGAVGLLYAAGNAFTVINPMQTVLDLLDCSLPVGGVWPASIGLGIHACGAHTGYMATTVTDINVDITVNYGNGFVTFENQIIAPRNVGDAALGDSGAVFYTTQKVFG